MVLIQVLFLGPMLVFYPALYQARRTAIRTYGALVTRYNRGFQDKWLDNPEQADEPLLGSADIQSLADMGNSYRFVDDMRPVPFGKNLVIRLALATALPGLPLLLLLLVMPLSEIVDALVKVAF